MDDETGAQGSYLTWQVARASLEFTFHIVCTYKWSAKVDFIFKYLQLKERDAILRRRSPGMNRT